MSTSKLMKIVRRDIKAEGLKVLSTTVHKGHLVFEVLHVDGRRQRVTVSGSPRVLEEAAQHTLRRVRKFAHAEPCS